MKNKLILGTVQFGLDYGINNLNGKPSQETVNQILDRAFESGITHLDTAEAYGNSQEVIGNYHQLTSNKFKIITKFSSIRTDLPSGLRERVKTNLKTLNVASLYCYMFHNYADFKSYYADFEDDIIALKKEGVIEKLGVSIYSNEELEDLLNYDEVDVAQLPFNLLDNTYYWLEILKMARARGIEIHSRSAFLQGLFFKSLDDIPAKIKPLIPHLKVLNKEASSNKISVADLALNYVYKQELINNVLIGVDSVEQLEQNLKSLDTEISIETIERMNSMKVEEKLLLNPSNWN